MKRLRVHADPSDATEGDSASAASDEAKPTPRLPKAVTRELTAARASALRTAILSQPIVGLAVAVFALLHGWRMGRAIGVEIAATPVDISDDGPLERARRELAADLPEEDADLMPWCLSQPPERLVEIAALTAASALNLVHEANDPTDRRRQALADTLASALDLDMRHHWRADLSFWSRLSKSTLMETIEAAPSITQLAGPKREKALKAHAKLKRDELAKVAARLLADAGWLPELLITPAPAGAIALTAAGEAQAAAIAAE
ncbi:MAG: hypothetical protein HY054_07665 [Proteobacteria bacterium]|nr:hypothetical protein [Pseudomonadota bacterium]